MIKENPVVQKILCLRKWFSLRMPWIKTLGKKTRGFERHERVKEVPKLSKTALPVIYPSKENEWESVATFNPAAINMGGKIHLLYRAIGIDSVSRIGYAVSEDGINFERYPRPVFEIPIESLSKSNNPNIETSFVSSYWSYSFGCEDPRVTEIKDDSKVYMCYVFFDGKSNPRIALTSIPVHNFARKWEWEESRIISPPGITVKSACILPEKINGNYVMFFRIFPSIFIDFVKDLRELDGETRFLQPQYEIPPREGKWDSLKIGMGAPPIKTREGWLGIYYGVDRDDPYYRYRIGAMLLKHNDPTEVICRSEDPILEPESPYEGRIAYPCGAVLHKDTLYVYYGANDMFVCVATAYLDEFLDKVF
ncbi:MAG: glycosidase [Candidatus Brockarchaeota archaeon]|nr:glycosidase [Candidatus Brockarchaeota archaeon]